MFARRALLTLVAALVIAGCASTKIVSQRDPALPSQMYSAILVDASLPTMAETQKAEQGVAKALTRRGYTAYAEEDLFFPQRSYSEDEVQAILVEHGIEAVLVIQSAGQGHASTYIPPKEVKETKVTGDEDDYKEVTTTTVQGGFEVQKAWADYVAELFDRASGELVWYAELESEGSIQMSHDHEDLAKSAAGRVADKLVSDDLLRRTAPVEPVEAAEEDGDFKPARLRNKG